MTVTDETGWEFETIKKTYANSGLEKSGKTTGVAWEIVRLSPASTALGPEETRVEKLSFAVEPRDGKEFTIQAEMRYHYAPAPIGGQTAEGTKMADVTLTLPGKRPARQ